MRRRPLAPVVAVAAAAAVVLTGCSGTEVAQSAPPAERLEDARAALDAAGSVSLDLSSRDVPPRENGVTAAQGQGVVSEAEPKFKGTITGTIEGVAGTVEVIAVGDTTWMKFFTPDYEETDLTALGAPNPATFFHPGDGISSLLTATEDPVAGEDAREGQEVLSTISGTLPGAQVTDLLHLGDGTGSYQVTYGLTENDQLRTATLTGPFFPDTTSTYLLVITEYGSPVEIDRP
jgi:lipoprotein LprG